MSSHLFWTSVYTLAVYMGTPAGVEQKEGHTFVLLSSLTFCGACVDVYREKGCSRPLPSSTFETNRCTYEIVALYSSARYDERNHPSSCDFTDVQTRDLPVTRFEVDQLKHCGDRCFVFLPRRVLLDNVLSAHTRCTPERWAYGPYGMTIVYDCALSTASRKHFLTTPQYHMFAMSGCAACVRNSAQRSYAISPSLF